MGGDPGAAEDANGMLHYVRIRNFALIESGELEFGPGFNVVTGESGAGKSILMAAIELLLGGRVDRGVIRTGADRCEVAGLLTVPEELRPRVGAMLDGAGIPFDSASGELQLRRVVTASGARNFVNDTPVSARLLGAVGGELIDLHGANEQLSLNVPARQLEAHRMRPADDGSGNARSRGGGVQPGASRSGRGGSARTPA